MRKQLDPRIPILINNNVQKNHRSFIVLVGDKGRDQVTLFPETHLGRFHRIIDRQPSFSSFSSQGISKTICTMVLQERTGFY